MRRLLTILAGMTIATGAMADGQPLQLSLTPDIAIHGRRQRIEGLCLSLWGENPQTAMALGIVNGSRGQSAGLSWALILNYADDYKGIQWALINYTKGDFLGWQGGFVNYAGRLAGLQLGLVNHAESAEGGVQIGLVNLLPQNELFTGLPDELAPSIVLINWRF